MSIRGLSKVPKREAAAINREIEEIGQRLQRRRKELDMTQEEFAEVLGINVNSIKYIEQGRRIPSLPMLLRLLKALKLKASFEAM